MLRNAVKCVIDQIIIYLGFCFIFYE
uniref:Uncharacterized protein n=1 Tax=Anguilla anguilla TaxID=7936 RepID=A0A0E9UVX6_ANGAN